VREDEVTARVRDESRSRRLTEAQTADVAVRNDDTTKPKPRRTIISQ
jgi:hypothetical protein